MYNFTSRPSLLDSENPENSWRAAISKDPIVALWPVIVITAIVVLWLAEHGSQNCTDGKCHQMSTKCESTDSVDDIIRILDDGLERHWSFVSWRISALVAIFTGIIVMIIFWDGFPNGLLAFIVFAAIFIGVYFSFNYICSNVLRPSVDLQRKLLRRLNSKIE